MAEGSQVVAPRSLAELQRQFGAALTTPFAFGPEPGEYRLQLEHYSSELTQGLLPRGERSGAEGLSVYNQQYWFRLFTVIQEEFPLLRHLLGVSELNQLSSAYLERHPSSSPCLQDLGRLLPRFLEEDPRWRRPHVLACAQLERIYQQVFGAPQEEPLHTELLDEAGQQALLARPLSFQPHLFLFEEAVNLVEWRQRILRDSDDEIELELSERPGWWAIFREGARTRTERLGPLQHRLLRDLLQGQTLDDACEGLAEELGEEELSFLSSNIQGWFAAWSRWGWFSAA